jgi:hypothetical protein
MILMVENENRQCNSEDNFEAAEPTGQMREGVLKGGRNTVLSD